MPQSKTSYTDLTHQVVRESRELLPFAEIMRRVNARAPITTRLALRAPDGVRARAYTCYAAICSYVSPNFAQGTRKSTQ